MSYQQEKQEAEKLHQKALSMTDDELVEEMYHESQKSYFRESRNVSVPLSHFSVLLSRYSEQAKKSSEINEKLQKATFWLTVVIVFLTIALLLTIPQINDFIFSDSDYNPKQTQNDDPNKYPSNHNVSKIKLFEQNVAHNSDRLRLSPS
ncbi:hypothetical protein [Pelagicoccus sp. SDUM812005]|uniref:hypothetical protein n=1 Tax=Pelagicoccus sp. SDUM812005 TaxID=3041257 RepID=UPI0028101E44|nr:hypothetical protein [Pelagicoccus sp. SDUM812005]MDQ8183849.1 hypothetical protein [Pelagicoccus sp. SDUM812005]